MWTLDKILVPTDFGPAAQKALEKALDLAQKFDAEIIVMHAFEPPLHAYPPAQRIPHAELTRELENAARGALQKIAAAHAEGVRMTTALYAGVPWEEILIATKEHATGLIVMGSGGRSGLARALTGSTAEKVVRYAAVPVLTIQGPPPSEPSEQAASESRRADELGGTWRI